jgi:hypothetical protein
MTADMREQSSRLSRPNTTKHSIKMELFSRRKGASGRPSTPWASSSPRDISLRTPTSSSEISLRVVTAHKHPGTSHGARPL